MKIGVIRQRYVASGGAERYLQALVRGLAALGHEIHLFANRWQTGPGMPGRFHRVPLVPGTSFLKALSFAWACEQQLRRHPCELVFSLERTLRQDVYRAGDGCHREWLAQRWCYDPAWKRATLKINPLHASLLRLEQRVYSPACTRWIIANSRRGKQEIVRHYGFPEDRITVIYNGVDSDQFKPPGPMGKTKDLRLLFAGTGFERKGLQFCIPLLARLPGAWRLLVVGKGNVARYQAMARRCGVAERVEFLGHNLDMRQIYPSADVLVHPAIYEPFANVCLEAMACGLPVVTSSINGASEIIDEGRNGAVVDHPEDLDALARAVRIFEDFDYRQKAARAAHATAERYPFSANVSATLDVLLAAAKEKAPATIRS